MGIDVRPFYIVKQFYRPVGIGVENRVQYRNALDAGLTESL